MKKLGRPLKYENEQERKAEYAKRARERYKKLKDGNIRPYEHLDNIEVHRGTPWYRSYYNAKGRASRNGWEFDLDIEFVFKLWTDAIHCPIFGKEYIIGDSLWTKSIDRFDSSRGYTKDNVWIISQKANAMKSNYTVEDFNILTEGLNKYMKMYL